MSVSVHPAPETKESTPIERLVGIADDIFDRATRLETLGEAELDDDTTRILDELRTDAFAGCLRLWKVVLSMLPAVDMDQQTRRDLEIDGRKVISRCYHRLGNLEDARKHITLAIDHGYEDGFISLGAICIDLEDYEGAESAFRSALSKGVQEMRAHAGLGELYFKLGTQALKDDPGHDEHFIRAEQEFVLAGKERFGEAYERAMDLFERIGWGDRVQQFGQRAADHYARNKSQYGDKLRALDARIRKLAGDERHGRLVEGVGRRLGDLLGGGSETE